MNTNQLIISAPKKRFLSSFERVEPVVKDSTISVTFDDCKRKYFYRFVLGYAPLFSPMQVIWDFGSALHTFRETLELTNGDFKKSLAVMLEFKVPDQVPKKYEFLDNMRLMQTLKAAHEHWLLEKQSKAIKVITIGDLPAVEQIFNIKFEDGEFIGGRFDQIVTWNGAHWIRDWKTTTKDITYWERGIDPNDQATRYIYAGGKIIGQKVEGIIYDVVQNAKTIIAKHHRRTVSKTSWQLEQFVEDRISTHTEMAKARDEDKYPKQEGYKCSFCDYARVCRSSNELAMARALKENYKFDPWDFTREGKVDE